MPRPIKEINAGSMADIAFLLLIFFLVTTTMDVDSGITRVLPPPVEKDPDKAIIKDRNVFEVLLNSEDMLLVENEPMDIKILRAEAKDFLSTNHDPLDERYPETDTLTLAALGGVITKTKGVISLMNDRGTSYDIYIQVQNELAAAVRELRDEMAMEKFNTRFEKIADVNNQKAIKKAIPVAISEAEPVDLGTQ